MSQPKRLAILCAGGPAPGLNSVIGAATIRAIQHGYEVLGLKDGFKWIMRGDTSHIEHLTIEKVSRIHLRGGSFIGIARDNPTKKKEHLDTAINTLVKLGVDKLITIGGDDTAFSAMTLEKESNGKISVVHVPKTIDNDLDLPYGIPTFGFHTARHIGVEIVKNLMEDAKTTSRWYFVVSMGRKAGHLALGIGKASGATLTLIPEEFKEDVIPLNKLVDTLAGSIIKRKALGQDNGVVVLAEGLVERLSPDDLDGLAELERDEHDNLRFAELDLGDIVKNAVRKRLEKLNFKTTIVSKNIGYELRCADPIPFDMEYTRDLGFSAVEFIVKGGTAAMISIQGSHFVPMFFKDILDKETGKTKIRMVDVNSMSFAIAVQYMIRLTQSDFADSAVLSKYAEICGITPEQFLAQFEYITEHETEVNEVEESLKVNFPESKR
ncbi:diphosphate--fructose-6-phosphate 1-phosphotransferase [Balneolaceae bacterium ANBcel3]|nr:diphosphate--fructose-6-phosphate 1-phosphotransferase [Balneolaceae bacterium ANBcel3]